MSQDRKLRMALVGCERIARRHLEVVQELTSDLDQVGVFGLIPKSFAAQDELGIAVNSYTTYPKMPGIDAIDLKSADDLLENRKKLSAVAIRPSGEG